MLAWLTNFTANRANRQNHASKFYSLSCLTLLLSVAAGVMLVVGAVHAGLDPTRHVYDAIVWVLIGWTNTHVGLALLMNTYCVFRRARGKMTAQYDADIVNVTLYWHFLLVTFAIAVMVLAGFPMVSEVLS